MQGTQNEWFDIVVDICVAWILVTCSGEADDGCEQRSEMEIGGIDCNDSVTTCQLKEHITHSTPMSCERTRRRGL